MWRVETFLRKWAKRTASQLSSQWAEISLHMQKVGDNEFSFQQIGWSYQEVLIGWLVIVHSRLKPVTTGQLTGRSLISLHSTTRASSVSAAVRKSSSAKSGQIEVWVLISSQYKQETVSSGHFLKLGRAVFICSQNSPLAVSIPDIRACRVSC